MPETNEWNVKKEMGITHKELFSKLPLIFKGDDFKIDGLRIIQAQNGKTIEIVLSEEGQRKLGLVVLPLTYVALNLFGFDETGKNEFIAHFDLQFFRGGG